MKEFPLVDSTSKYDYCLSEIKFSGVIWSAQLPDGKWVLVKDGNGNFMFPIWPCIDSAMSVCNKIINGSSPVSIDIDSFKKKWIKGLNEDGYQLAFFPTFDPNNDLDVLSVPPLRFLKDLINN